MVLAVLGFHYMSFSVESTPGTSEHLSRGDPLKCLYSPFKGFDKCFMNCYRFSIEELMLATGASAPVARKTKRFV